MLDYVGVGDGVESLTCQTLNERLGCGSDKNIVERSANNNEAFQ